MIKKAGFAHTQATIAVHRGAPADVEKYYAAGRMIMAIHEESEPKNRHERGIPRTGVALLEAAANLIPKKSFDRERAGHFLARCCAEDFEIDPEQRSQNGAVGRLRI